MSVWGVGICGVRVYKCGYIAMVWVDRLERDGKRMLRFYSDAHAQTEASFRQRMECRVGSLHHRFPNSLHESLDVYDIWAY